MVFLVGQFGFEFARMGQPSTASERTMVRVMEPFLTAIGVPFFVLNTDADLGRMDEAFALAQTQKTAVVLLVTAPMAWN